MFTPAFADPGDRKRPFKSLAARFVPSSILVFALMAGCSSAEDREIETKLKTVTVHRSAHPHYPVILHDDFGNDSQPEGITVNAYSFYVQETPKADPHMTLVSQSEATKRLARTFERSIQAILSAEAETPAPKPPYPINPDWKSAPHPVSGTYTISGRCGPTARTFDISLTAKSDSAQALAELRPIFAKNAELVVSDGFKAQDKALASLATPGGFRICTEELLSVQQGSRGTEPHLSGGALLLTPVDKTLALKALQQSIHKILDSTRHLSSPPATAHVVVDGPNFSDTYAVPLDGHAGESGAVEAALARLGERIDHLNSATS